MKTSENRMAEEVYQKSKQQRDTEKKQKENEILFGYISVLDK